MLGLALAPAVALLCVSCSKPEFWISGLRLPPGSHVISRKEASQAGSLGGLNLAMGNRVDQVLMVTFNNSARWEKITLHFDRELKARGFSDEPEVAGRALGVNPAHLPNRDLAGHIRIYGNPDSKLAVTLMSMQGAAQRIGGGADAVDMSSLGVGDYVLRVIKLR